MSGLPGVVVRPGDKLIVCLERDLPDAELKRFADSIRQHLEGVEPCFLTGVTQLAVFRPDSGTDG